MQEGSGRKEGINRIFFQIPHPKSQGPKSQGPKSQGPKSPGPKSQGPKSQGTKSQGLNPRAPIPGTQISVNQILGPKSQGPKSQGAKSHFPPKNTLGSGFITFWQPVKKLATSISEPLTFHEIICLYLKL